MIGLMLLLQVVLIGINALFAATEIAVLQLNPNKLRRMVAENVKGAARVLKLAEQPAKFLSTIQVGITFAGNLGSAFAATNFSGPLAAWIYNGLGWTFLAQGTWITILIVIIPLVLAYFTLVFGELVPKQFAMHKPFQVAKLTSGVITGLSVVSKPLVTLLSVSTKAVLRLLGIKKELAEEAITEAEIRLMVDVGHESGAIDSEEKQMIENVFELDKTMARDVMTHRLDVVTLEADAEQDEIVQTIIESGLSRIPVYDDGLDNILGVLSTRIYLLNLRQKSPRPLRELLRPAYFVPETVLAGVLLRNMQKSKDHLALVVDEYGGFSGLVTMEDVIEEIVGNIYDEFDEPDEPEIILLEKNLWRIAGDTEIETIEEALDVSLPEEREYDTLGGLVFNCLSSIPNDGTELTLDTNGLHIETEPIVDHHVEFARVSILPTPENTSNKDDD